MLNLRDLLAKLATCNLKSKKWLIGSTSHWSQTSTEENLQIKHSHVETLALNRGWRWDRIRSRLQQDSEFFFRTRMRSKKFRKNRIRIHFSISAVAGVCVIISYVKTWLNYGWIDYVAGVWTGVGFSNLKKCRTRIQKFWNRSWVGVWKSDSGHLWQRMARIGHDEKTDAISVRFGWRSVFETKVKVFPKRK